MGKLYELEKSSLKTFLQFLLGVEDELEAQEDQSS